MKRSITAILAFIIITITAKATDDKNTVPAELKIATVYRTGAELLHNAKATLKQGSSELIIEGISSYVDINSLQINCPAPVTILGVEFSNNYLGDDIAIPAVKKLQDSADKVNNDIEKIDVSISTTTELLTVLKANKEIKGTQTGLSVAELIKLMDYYKLKSIELQNDLAALNSKKKKLQEVVDKIELQIEEEKKKNTTSGGRVILQLFTSIGGNYDLTVSYITQNAYWTPYYDIKADDVKSPMKIIYKAKIVQTTGIDWKKVKLSLSTSTPTQYGNAPILKSWFLAYINPVVVMNRGLTMSNTIQSYDYKPGITSGLALNEVVVTGAFSKKRDRADNQPLYIVNGAEMSSDEYAKLDPKAIKDIKIVQNDDAANLYGARAANGAVVVTLKDGLEDYVSVSDNELDITYDIDLPYDVPTNGKQQIATLKEATMNASYKYYAVPKLDKDAFLLAEVSDWEQLNLLPGEANIIFEGTYIGKTFIDPASTNDTLNLTLGKDKRVVIKREKLKDFSSVKFLGSNKLQKITYELTVKNNKKDPIKLLLKDQYPISTNKEIEVELLESSDAMNNTEIGVLTWKLDLAPGEIKKVRISYSVKYPKGKQLNLN
jgi:hypothetical protein